MLHFTVHGVACTLHLLCNLRTSLDQVLKVNGNGNSTGWGPEGSGAAGHAALSTRWLDWL